MFPNDLSFFFFFLLLTHFCVPLLRALFLSLLTPLLPPTFCFPYISPTDPILWFGFYFIVFYVSSATWEGHFLWFRNDKSCYVYNTQCIAQNINDSCGHYARSLEKRVPDSLQFNPLNPELNPICYLLALLAHHFLHVSRIRVKSLTVRLLMSYIWSTYSWCF